MSEAKKKRAPAAAKSATRKSTAAKKPAAKKSAASSGKTAVAKKKAVGTKKPAARPASGSRKKKAVPAAPPVASDPIERRLVASRALAIELARAALEKKAERIEIVDVSEKVDYADFLVLTSGRNDRQIKAIADSVEAQASTHKIHPQGRDGVRQGQWAVLDFGDVVVHVFLEEARQYYDLEGLWMDAPRVLSPELVAAAAER